MSATMSPWCIKHINPTERRPQNSSYHIITRNCPLAFYVEALTLITTRPSQVHHKTRGHLRTMGIHEISSAGSETDSHTGQGRQSDLTADANHDTTTEARGTNAQGAWSAYSASAVVVQTARSDNEGACQIVMTKEIAVCRAKDMGLEDIQAAITLCNMSLGGSRPGGTA